MSIVPRRRGHLRPVVGLPPAGRRPAPPPALVFEDVWRDWLVGDPARPRRVPGVRGIRLSLGQHETLVVRAAPGSGGTTLLLLAAGLARPDRGRVVRPPRRGVRPAFALVPTHPALPDHWTPADALAAALGTAAGRARGVLPRATACRLARGEVRALCGADAAGAWARPFGELPPAVRWSVALVAARAGGAPLLLVDRPPDDASRRALAGDLRWPWAARVAEGTPWRPPASLLVLRPGVPAPAGARELLLRPAPAR